MKTKKFNYAMAKAGHKIQTKLGNPARIITLANTGHLIVAIQPRWGMEEAVKYNLDGTRWHNPNSAYDLEMVKAYYERN